MDPEIEKIIKNQMEKLPEDIRALFDGESLREKILSIANKNGLTGDQPKILETETYLVLIGLVHPDDFESELQQHLIVDDLKLDNLVKSINQEILGGLREKLSQVYETTEDEDEETEVNEELDERFANVPEEIKKEIVASGYHGKLYEIATAHKLNIPQMGALEEVATDVIVGKIHPEKFEDSLRERVDLPAETLKALASEMTEKIFKPIRLKMEGDYDRPKTPEEKPTILADTIITPVEAPKPASPSGEIKIIRPDLAPKEVKPIAPANMAGPGEVMGKEKIRSILESKLGGEMKTVTVNSDHSLNNMASQNAVSTPKKSRILDPYRELPE